MSKARHFDLGASHFELGALFAIATRSKGDTAPVDVDGLTLVTAPGAAISGAIVSDTGEPFDFKPAQVQVAARPGSPDAPAMGPGPGGSRVGDDGSFSLRNITDAVLIRAQVPQGWAMKSVVINGQDITDTPMEFPAGQTVSGMQIVLTKKVTSLSGQVTDSRGNPVLDATIVVFPADEKLWTFQSRFIKAVRPDQDGKFQVTGLPGPERYLAVALQGLEDGQAALVEPGRLRPGERRVGHVAECGPAPERKRLPQVRRVPRAAETTEPLDVELVRLHVDEVAGRPRHDALRAECLPQGVDVHLQRSACARGRALAPDPVDQPVGRDHLVRVEQEQPQKRPRALAPERQ